MVGVALKGNLNNSLSKVKYSKPKGGKTVVSLKIYAEPTRNNNTRLSSLANSEPEEELSKKPTLIEGRCKGTAASSTKAGISNLVKKKAKLDKSGSQIVGRKALADISNVRTSSSIAKTKDTSKLSYDSRNSLVGARAWSSSLRKPLSGTVRTASNQVTINYHSVRKGCKETKTNFDATRTKSQNGQLVNATSSRIYGQHHPLLIRKSFPATKQVKKLQESTVKSQGCKDGLSVNSNVDGAVTSQVTSHGSRFGKTRFSDGFIVKGLKGRSTLDTGASRRSVKLVQTQRIINSKTGRPSNSGGLQTRFSKPPTLPDISSKENDKKGKLSSTKNIDKEEVPSFDKSHLSTAENVPKKTLGRRKSFTSLLTSRSKENLPNIYDVRNHLEVSEYIDDIYQYYWVIESQNQPLKRYMDMQTEITPHMRGILINWLIEVHLKFDLMQETLFLMVTLLDQFLSLVSIEKNKMQLVGLTALLLASKYEDFWHPRIIDLIGVSADSYTRDEMLRMENAFLTKLKFRLNAPTPYVFMLRFIKAAQSNKTFEHLAFYLIELCLVEYEALKYKPSLLCASAIYLAKCTLRMNPKWTPLLQKHTHYEEDQIRQCAEMILKFHKAAKTSLLRVTYDKYMKPEFSRAAAINPMEMLPQ